MPNPDASQKWGTLVAAVAAIIAATTGVLNLWFTHRIKSDKIRVAWGLIDPQITPGYFLNIVNLSNHPVRLADYGYVMRNGKLLSLPQLETEDPDYARINYGNLLLESRNASFETGTTLRDHPAGVYARTTSQIRPTIAFRHDTPKWMSYWLRTKILARVAYD